MSKRKKGTPYYLLVDACPECYSENSSVLPSFSDCPTCVKARMDYLDNLPRLPAYALPPGSDPNYPPYDGCTP